jgi:hypothetical protein
MYLKLGLTPKLEKCETRKNAKITHYYLTPKNALLNGNCRPKHCASEMESVHINIMKSDSILNAQLAGPRDSIKESVRPRWSSSLFLSFSACLSC